LTTRDASITATVVEIAGLTCADNYFHVAGGI